MIFVGTTNHTIKLDRNQGAAISVASSPIGTIR
jgi:hypothetical protein